MTNAVTVGVDIGTTSVKAIAVDADGHVVARARVPHTIETGAANQLEHDARQAWRRGPQRAWRAVTEGLDRPVAGVGMASMVPSLTAVNRQGVPFLPGLLYGDSRGAMPGSDAALDVMPDAEGFLRWAVGAAPDAFGYWPCQAVAGYALARMPVVDSAVSATFGSLYGRNGWNEDLIRSIGARVDQMPMVVPTGQPAGTFPGTDTVLAAGTIDAFSDQVVAGATEPGDVLVVFGATLIVWVVIDQWRDVPGLFTVPHTVPGRVLAGGPSNAGALFVDWARELLRGVRRPGAPRSGAGRRSAGGVGGAPAGGVGGAPVGDGRAGDPARVPVWLPYLRGERTPYNDPTLRASLHDLDISQGPTAVERAAYEASGFVIRRMLEATGIEGRRIVASGGGTMVEGWMAGVADAVGLPVETVAVPEGAALGAAFFARLAAGLEPSLDEVARWYRTGRRIEPDPVWAKAADARYRRFAELRTGR